MYFDVFPFRSVLQARTMNFSLGEGVGVGVGGGGGRFDPEAG